MDSELLTLGDVAKIIKANLFLGDERALLYANLILKYNKNSYKASLFWLAFISGVSLEHPCIYKPGTSDKFDEDLHPRFCSTYEVNIKLLQLFRSNDYDAYVTFYRSVGVNLQISNYSLFSSFLLKAYEKTLEHINED